LDNPAHTPPITFLFLSNFRLIITSIVSTEFSFRDFLEQQQVPGGAFPMGRGKRQVPGQPTQQQNQQAAMDQAAQFFGQYGINLEMAMQGVDPHASRAQHMLQGTRFGDLNSFIQAGAPIAELQQSLSQYSADFAQGQN
jgi:hypothetical protein